MHSLLSVHAHVVSVPTFRSKRENLGFVTYSHALFGTVWHGCRLRKCSSLFPRNPLADVRWAIPELEAVRFAAPKEADSVLID